jgi:hypothetical protein
MPRFEFLSWITNFFGLVGWEPTHTNHHNRIR